MLISCGEDHALKKEKFYFEEEHIAWLPADTLDDVFLMRDNNGITTSFYKNGDDYYFNKSWTSVLGINTRMSLTEYRYLNYASPFGGSLHISLTAGWPPYGDELYVSLNGTAFSWDFNFNTVTRIEYGDRYLSKMMVDDDYEETDKIHSTVEFLDTLRTAERLYHDVMHFTFLDQNTGNDPHPFGVKHIYLARYWGLIRYDLENGMWYERVFE
jgi:hypothetical protein